MRIHSIVRGLAAVLVCALPAVPAMAARFELQAGASFMGNPSNGYDTPAVFGEVIFDPSNIGSSNFTWSPDVTAGWIDGRNIAKYNHDPYTTRESVWLLAGGVRFHYGAPNAWYQPIFFSFQPAVDTGDTQSLSTHYEFVSTLGYQAQHWSVEFRHISNGSFHEPNRGETMALLGYAF